MIVAEKGQGDRFGIGSDVSYSILQVAELLDLDYRFIPDRRGNRKISSLITKNTRDLGWKPKKDLQNYLKKVR
jgi:UDP-glucose 4-epimerase